MARDITQSKILPLTAVLVHILLSRRSWTICRQAGRDPVSSRCPLAFLPPPSPISVASTGVPRSPPHVSTQGMFRATVQYELLPPVLTALPFSQSNGRFPRHARNSYGMPPSSTARSSRRRRDGPQYAWSTSSRPRSRVPQPEPEPCTGPVDSCGHSCEIFDIIVGEDAYAP